MQNKSVAIILVHPVDAYICTNIHTQACMTTHTYACMYVYASDAYDRSRERKKVCCLFFTSLRARFVNKADSGQTIHQVDYNRCLMSRTIRQNCWQSHQGATLDRPRSSNRRKRNLWRYDESWIKFYCQTIYMTGMNDLAFSECECKRSIAVPVWAFTRVFRS